VTCPTCQSLRAEVSDAKVLELRLRAEVDALRASERRARERVAVLIGRVGVALDMIETERARIENG